MTACNRKWKSFWRNCSTVLKIRLTQSKKKFSKDNIFRLKWSPFLFSKFAELFECIRLFVLNKSGDATMQWMQWQTQAQTLDIRKFKFKLKFVIHENNRAYRNRKGLHVNEAKSHSHNFMRNMYIDTEMPWTWTWSKYKYVGKFKVDRELLFYFGRYCCCRWWWWWWFELR